MRVHMKHQLPKMFQRVRPLVLHQDPFITKQKKAPILLVVCVKLRLFSRKIPKVLCCSITHRYCDYKEMRKTMYPFLYKHNINSLRGLYSSEI